MFPVSLNNKTGEGCSSRVLPKNPPLSIVEISRLFELNVFNSDPDPLGFLDKRQPLNEKLSKADVRMCAHITLECYQLKKKNALVQYIQILPPSHHLKVAKNCIQKCPRLSISDYFLQFPFTLTSSEERFELAKCFLEYSSCVDLVEHIEKFDLSPEHRFAMAKLLARIPRSHVVQYLNHFNLSTEELKEMVTLCATTPHSGFAQYVDNFGITDPLFLLKAAELCADTEYSYLAQYIDNFKIAQPEDIYRLLKIAAKKKGSDVAMCIDKFSFLSKEERFELALLCAETEDLGIQLFIQKFNLSDKERVIVAKRRAQIKNSHLASYIKNFEIADPKERFEVAKLDASTEGSTMEAFIDNFELQDPQELAVIAKLCMQRKDSILCENIKKFRLSQIQRLEIAEHFALHNSSKIACTIGLFDLSQEQRFHIARLCAQKDAYILLSYLNQFELSPDQIKDLVLDCAVSNPSSILYELWINSTSFPLTVEEEQQVFFLAARKIGIEAYEGRYFQSSMNMRGTGDLPQKIFKKKDANVNDSIKILRTFIGQNFSNAPDLLHLVDEIENLALPKATIEERIHLQKQLLLWLTASLFVLNSHKLSKEEIAFILEQGFLNHLKAFQSPLLRTTLNHLLPLVVKTEEDRAFLQDKKLYPWEKKSNHTKVLRILLVALRKEISGATLQQFLEQIGTLQHQGHHFLEEVGHFRTLILALYLFFENRQLTALDKQTLLLRLTQEATVDNKLSAEQFLKNLQALIAVIEFKEANKLKDPHLSLLQANEQAFKTCIPIGKMEGDFFESYAKTFDSKPKISSALHTYAAKMRAQPNPHLMEALGIYATSVLNGTWPDVRYDPKFNPHLQQIFSEFPTIREKWLKNSSYPLTDLLPEVLSQKKQSDMFGFLQSNLLTFQHLDLSSLPILNEYLNTKDAEERKQLWDGFKGRKPSKKDKDTDYFETLLQKQCLRLVQESTKIKTIDQLKLIETTLCSHPPFQSSQFLKDVETMIQQLTQADKFLNLSSYQVMETDDPFRLLLCGTEVGSCQRVDEEGGNNRGLEGYFLHGQTKLDAIVGPDDTIAARAMSRLLLNEKNEPVLLVERIYPAGVRAEFRDALLELNRRRAQELGIPLVVETKEIAKGDLYGQKLKSLGGRAPYEYVDSAGGLKERGQFTVTKAYYLDPPAQDSLPAMLNQK